MIRQTFFSTAFRGSSNERQREVFLYKTRPYIFTNVYILSIKVKKKKAYFLTRKTSSKSDRFDDSNRLHKALLFWILRHRGRWFNSKINIILIYDYKGTKHKASHALKLWMRTFFRVSSFDYVNSTMRFKVHVQAVIDLRGWRWYKSEVAKNIYCASVLNIFNVDLKTPILRWSKSSLSWWVLTLTFFIRNPSIHESLNFNV